MKPFKHVVATYYGGAYLGIVMYGSCTCRIQDGRIIRPSQTVYQVGFHTKIKKGGDYAL